MFLHNVACLRLRDPGRSLCQTSVLCGITSQMRCSGHMVKMMLCMSVLKCDNTKMLHELPAAWKQINNGSNCIVTIVA